MSRFRDLLVGERVIDLPKGRDRELIDDMTGLSCRLAARFPDEYLAVFNNERWVTPVLRAAVTTEFTHVWVRCRPGPR